MAVNVAVLFGGDSTEHEVSLISGKQVCLNADKNKFNIFPIIISRSGDWLSISLEKAASLPDPIQDSKACGDYIKANAQIVTPDYLAKKKIKAVFIALHGAFGEDGRIQGLLESLGISYTGPGVLASAIGMDKLRFRYLCTAQNIKIPEYFAADKNEVVSDKLNRLGTPPYFVKPHAQGSSVGMSVVRNKNELAKAINKALKYDEVALVDKYIKGTEVTVAILGNKRPKALPVIEIRPKKGEFFDYQSKYSESGADEICPAEISSKLTRQVQRTALSVYQIVGAKGFSRVDFIIDDKEKPICLEINTIPGLTPMSLFPKAAKAAGISYRDLITIIINYARE